MTTVIEHDPINHPRHYISENGMEVIDVIEAYGLADSFHLGNVLKYALRANSKGDCKENIGKALWYAKRFDTRTSMDDEDFCWPSAPPGVEEMFPIEAIIREFKLEGALAEAVGDLLNLCIGDDAEPLDQCIENLEQAMKEAA